MAYHPSGDMDDAHHAWNTSPDTRVQPPWDSRRSNLPQSQVNNDNLRDHLPSDDESSTWSSTTSAIGSSVRDDRSTSPSSTSEYGTSRSSLDRTQSHGGSRQTSPDGIPGLTGDHEIWADPEDDTVHGVPEQRLQPYLVHSQTHRPHQPHQPHQQHHQHPSHRPQIFNYQVHERRTPSPPPPAIDPRRNDTPHLDDDSWSTTSQCSSVTTVVELPTGEAPYAYRQPNPYYPPKEEHEPTTPQVRFNPTPPPSQETHNKKKETHQPKHRGGQGSSSSGGGSGGAQHGGKKKPSKKKKVNRARNVMRYFVT